MRHFEKAHLVPRLKLNEHVDVALRLEIRRNNRPK